MGDAAFIRETELAILNAPFEQDGWRLAVEAISRACHSSAANLVGFGGPLRLSLNLFTGRESERAQRYFSRPELWGRCNWRVNSAGPAMSVQHEAHYAAYRQHAVTSDYDDAVSDLDMPFGCQSPLIADSRSFLGLALLRSQRDGPCDSETLTRFSRLTRHLLRAFRVEMALEGEAAEMMVGDVSLLHSAVVLIDRHGCVTAHTPAAEALAGDGGPIRLGGLLFELSCRKENARMQSALARLLSDDMIGASWLHEMHVTHGHSVPAKRWIARAFRLPRRKHGLGFDPHVAIAFEPLGDCSAAAV